MINSFNPWSKDPNVKANHDSKRASGFKEEFKDEQGSFNQVRHFAGAFVNAYYGGLAAHTTALAAGALMTLRLPFRQLIKLPWTPPISGKQIIVRAILL